MHNIFAIFWRDLKRIVKNPMALIVAIGITVLPCLYAWFNIAACWDPYGNTNGIKVAVANTDSGVSLDGMEVNIGDLVVQNLRENDQIGWQFVDEEDALDGVKSGRYYAAVVIPTDFSEGIASILSDDIQKTSIEYYVNEKKNAIAPKITDKGVGVIQQQVNSTFISSVTEVIGKVLNLTDEELNKRGIDPVDKLLENLNKIDADLGQVSTAIDAFKSASLSIDDLLKTTQLNLPDDASKLVEDSQKTVSDLTGVINSSKSASERIGGAIGEILEIVSGQAGELENGITEAFDILATDSAKAAEELLKLKQPCYDIISLNNTLSTTLQELNSKLPVPLEGITRIIEKLGNSTAKQQAILAKIDEVAAAITSAGSAPAEAQKELLALIGEGKQAASDASGDFKATVLPQLNTTLGHLYDTLGDVSGLLTKAGDAVPKINSTLGGVSSALGHTIEALDSTNALIKTGREKIGGIVTELSSVSEDERWEKLLEIIRNDPSVASDFMSSPVEINSNSFYPIENYGSALAPFYSILAIWVGGLILCAILKTKVAEDDRLNNFKPYQVYFGRYLLFMAFGILQTLIICIGDIWFLGIQCLNKPLFILAGVLASIVFTNIIYTLTMSFGDIGKAIAVILLVVQVAGAGGTFPVEVMPEFFGAVNPWLPFTAGINAMRETIGGIYQNAYLIDLLKLLAYLPISLFIGLVLRKPVAKFNDFFTEKLEETQLM